MIYVSDSEIVCPLSRKPFVAAICYCNQTTLPRSCQICVLPRCFDGHKHLTCEARCVVRVWTEASCVEILYLCLRFMAAKFSGTRVGVLYWRARWKPCKGGFTASEGLMMDSQPHKKELEFTSHIWQQCELQQCWDANMEMYIRNQRRKAFNALSQSEVPSARSPKGSPKVPVTDGHYQLFLACPVGPKASLCTGTFAPPPEQQ